MANGADLSGASGIDGALLVKGIVGGDVVLRGSPHAGTIEIAEHAGDVIERDNPQVGAVGRPEVDAAGLAGGPDGRRWAGAQALTRPGPSSGP